MIQLEKISYIGIRYCLKCGDETDHELIYLDKYLKAGRCLTCNQVFDNRGILIGAYYHDFVERVLMKPFKIYKELEKSPRGIQKLWFLFRFMGQFFKEPKKELHNLHQMYKRHTFK
ncbi:MAG: hypothetical protein ACM3YE_00345 [Bacteroidota bacterium]